jgi:hypothetical protein
MADVVLDTNALGEFFEQYFDNTMANRGQGAFAKGDYISENAAREINRIIVSHRRNGDLAGGLIVISCFAFVELFRKWDQITNGKVDLGKLRGLMEQPPDWLNIASFDETLVPFFFAVPTHVYMKDGFKSVEWADSVHVATALARGDGNSIATTDTVMQNMNLTSRVKCL